jgi:cytochrome c-type biogenesis protein CcmH
VILRSIAINWKKLIAITKQVLSGRRKRKRLGSRSRAVLSRQLIELNIPCRLAHRCGVVTALAAIVLVPVVASALYLANGSPQLPGQPLEARLRAVHRDTSIAALVSQAEAHLERSPDDARGYEVLAPVYLRLGRFADAVNARRKLIALSGESGERQSDLGEALVAEANGLVTAEAKSAFERALTLEPDELKARFYLGMAAEQDGDRAKAAAIWREMIDKAPAGASWLPMVRDALARLGVSPPIAGTTAPSADDVAAAANTMSERDRDDMVRGMVARLANRLKESGSDVEGWQRLLRAYMVLGERDKANAAAADAKRALASDPDKLRRIEDMVKSLGLEG